MSKCIICGSEANNYKYCYHCYKKYQSENYVKNNKKYKSKNGTIVKSKSEMIICDILTDHNITFQYEKEINITIYDEFNKPKNITIKPDFYIEELTIDNRKLKNIYIEHFGLLSKEEYRWKTLFKLMIYYQMGITLLCTEEKDIEDAHTNIINKLKSMKNNTINY